MMFSTFSERSYNFVQHKIRSVLIYENPDNSTFRYRVTNLIDYSSDKNQKIVFFTIDEYLRNWDLVHGIATSITFVRCPISPLLREVITKAKNRGINIGFDTDDLVFSLKYLDTLLRALKVEINHKDSLDYWYSYISRRQELCELADYFTCSTSTLATVLKSNFSKPTFIVPNIVSDLDYCNPDCVHNEGAFDRRTFKIGYMSGSPSHQADFNYIKFEILEFLVAHPRVKLLIRGYPLDLKGLEPVHDQIEIRDFVQPGQLSCAYQELDLNLAPLKPSIFTECKSNIKFLEAAAVSVPTLATPSTSFSEIIENGVNGFLGAPLNWYELLEISYSNNSDRLSLGRMAYDITNTEFSTHGRNESIEDFLSFLRDLA